MPFGIVRGDITKLECDAIVNAANRTLLGGGGVDGAIHRAAGAGLLRECMTLGGCETGEAKITGGYNLPCRYVIHTVGPIWQGGGRGERVLLEACYRNSLELAKENGCESVAFPMISAGVYGYPAQEALEVAVGAIRGFLDENEMNVTLVVFDRSSFCPDDELIGDIAGFIDSRITPEMDALPPMAQAVPPAAAAKEAHRRPRLKDVFGRNERESYTLQSSLPQIPREEAELFEAEDAMLEPGAPFCNAELSGIVSQLDESFSEMLLRKIDEKGITDAECYKRANVDRKLFSKIRGDRGYRPSKPTVLAFAIALELPLEETRDMLMKAGFALSHSNKSDIIIEYFISNGRFDIYEINEALFAFDQNLLGC